MKILLGLFQPPALSTRASAGVLVLRLIAGLAFMFHGYGKIQHPFSWMGPDSGTPGIFQAMAALSEFGGGLAWILGLLTPLASSGMACTMVVAVWMHAVVMKDPFVGKGAKGGSFEPAALFLCMSILFILAGPGKFSLDRLIFGKKEPS